jgi:hypothetical protein
VSGVRTALAGGALAHRLRRESLENYRVVNKSRREIKDKHWSPFSFLHRCPLALLLTLVHRRRIKQPGNASECSDPTDGVSEQVCSRLTGNPGVSGWAVARLRSTMGSRHGHVV